MTGFNTIYYLILAIIGLCIPIYYLIGRQKFVWYLIVLLGGTLFQKFGSMLIYPISPTLSVILYEALGVIMSIALILFILYQYIDLKTLQDKRFVIFTITAILGIGLKMLENYNDSPVWTVALAYYIVIAILGVGFLMTQNLQQLIRKDGGLLLSIIAGALIYMVLYEFYLENASFYWLWLFVMGIQVITWLLIGLLQLKTRNAGALQRSLFHQKNNLIQTSHSFQLFNDVMRSGTVDRW